MDVDIIKDVAKPWLQEGLIGSVAVALAVLCWLLWKWGEKKQEKLEALYEARLKDRDLHTDQYQKMLIDKITSDNKLADGMEALERIVDRIKP